MTRIFFVALILCHVASAVDREINIPDASPSAPDSCRAGTGLSVAHCLNRIVRLKDAYRTQSWRVTIQAGSYDLKETILLFGVENLEIRGLGTELHARGAPSERKHHQYYSVLILNSKNVTLRQLRFFGDGLSAQRAVGICSTPGVSTNNVTLTQLELKDYPYFNVLVGNAPSAESFETIATYPQSDPSDPAQYFIRFVRDLPSSNRFCGGEIHGVAFRQNRVFMKSVGFYVVPTMARLSASVPVSQPVLAPTKVPAWYAAADAYSRKYDGIEVDRNEFLNDLRDAEQAKANQYHSAMKFQWTSGARITGNTIDATTLPKAFESGAAINFGPGMFRTLIQSNTIKMPANLPYAFGVNILSNYLRHPVYGFGDKQIFGADSDITVTRNNFVNSTVRFMDCSVQLDAADLDTRPFSRERDELVKRGLFNELIKVQWNLRNGFPFQDRALIRRQSTHEPDWVKSHEGRILCRSDLRIQF